MRDLLIHLLPLGLVLQVGLVAIGFFVLVGARRAAAATLTGGLVALATGQALHHVLPAVPTAVLVLAAPVFGLIAINTALRALFGREVAGQVTGTWIVRLCDLALCLLLAPLRLFRRRR